jgi:Fe-S cluster assembly iron-binding protein IscA
MTEKEERILRKNVDDVQQNIETIQEMKIYNAMKKGIVEGKKREKRRIYSTGMGVVAAAAVALLFTYSTIGLPNKVAQPSVQSASTKNTDNFKAYRSFSRLEPALASALEQNLVVPVGQSAENKGYRIDVTGAVTDGRKVYVLYSVQNNTDEVVIHADFELQFEGIKESPLHKGASLSMLASESRIQPGQSMDFIYSTNLSPSVKYPKKVNYNIILTETSDKALLSSSIKYRTSLDVAFDLDPDMLKAQEHILDTDGTLTVDGQKIRVNQVQYTPLSTYVDLEYNQNNDKQIFQLINPVLISKKGDAVEKLYYPDIINSDNSEVYTDNSKFTLVFKNSKASQQPDSVTLKAFGISAVEKDQMKIVVDLNKYQLIEAPGSGLELVTPTPENDAMEGTILLRHKLENAQYLNYYTRTSETFTDGEGKEHQFAYTTDRSSVLNFGGFMRAQDGVGVDEFVYNFGAKAKSYPQPLTITLEKYINPIMDTQAVELYSINR